ncbi:MAG: hypothetical protein LC749_15575 [Actinobacteria bacterium]|nr:hypothetical protein [Actinomycetota bacterium]
MLLPTVALVRRRDLAEVIGEALHACLVEGKSRATVAVEAGVLSDTARGWLRRFVVRAPEIRELFSTWALTSMPAWGHRRAPPRGGPADALEAIGVAAAAERLGASGHRRCGPSWPGPRAGCCCPTRVALCRRRAEPFRLCGD